MKTTAKIILLTAALVCASCGNPKSIPYFQDLENGKENSMTEPKTIRIEPGDKLSIIVNSRDPQITSMFNLVYTSRMIGMNYGTGYTTSGNSGVSGYCVDPDGNIDFPVVGKIHVVGMTRQAITSEIKRILVEKRLVSDPVITVEFMNLKVSVMGEVANPGLYPIDRDEYTIVDAISAAGDLTILGERGTVKVLRNVNGTKKTFEIDLRSANQLLHSPAYYLQQNDIIYVEPNKVRARQSTVNGNTLLTPSFWISIASFALTVLLAVKKF